MISVFDRDLACVDRSLRPVHRSGVADRQMSIKRALFEDDIARLAVRYQTLLLFSIDEIANVQIWGVVRFRKCASTREPLKRIV